MPKKDPSPLQLAQKAGDVLKKKVNSKAFASTSTALSRSDGHSLYFFCTDVKIDCPFVFITYA